MTDYLKSASQIKSDTELLDRRIPLLTSEIIDMIRTHVALDPTYESSVFRPSPDFAMLLFKKSRKEKSSYTLNLLTLKPTANSACKILLSSDIIAILV